MPRKGMVVSLKVRLLAIVIVIFIASLWFLTVSITSKLEVETRQLIASQEIANVAYIAADIEAKLNQRISLLNQNAKLIAQHFHSPEEMMAFLTERIGLQSLFPAGLVVIDANGHGLAAFPANLEQVQASFFPEREYFQDAMKSGKTVIGKPRLSQFDQKAFVAIAAPIREQNGDIKGVLVGYAFLSDKSLFGQVERQWEGAQGVVIVSDPRFHLIVSSSDPSNILQPFSPSFPISDPALVGKEGLGLSKQGSGNDVLVAAKQIPSAGWIVQKMLPTQVVYAPIQQIQNRAYGIAFFLTCFVFFFIWWSVNLALIPLDYIGVAFRRMARKQGELFELPLTGDSEIRDMTKSFNALVAQRMEYEEALRVSEARLTRAELTSKTGNWELHLREQRIHASPGAIQVYGLQSTDSDYPYIKTACLPEYRAQMDTAMKNLIQHGEPYDVEFKIRTKDQGEIKDIHSIAHYDKENQIVFGVIQDVTERKQILRALEQETTRRKLLLEQTQDGFVLLRQDGSVVEWNPAFAAMLGYDDEAMSKLNVCDWDASLSQEELDQITRHLGSSHMTVETRHRRQNGSMYEAEISVNGLAWNGQNYLFCLIRDITKRKQSEAALRESEARFRAVIEASPIPYAMNDQELNVTYLNPAFTRTFGYTVEDIPHVDVWLQKAYPDPEYRQQTLEKWQAHVALSEQHSEIKPEPVEANICCKNGETRIAQVATEPLHNTNDWLYVVSFVDITDNKNHERQLEEMAHYDALTGLPNRTLLSDRLHQAMAQVLRNKQRIAVGYLDLDGFKPVNDKYGHEIGDKLLIAVAERMKGLLRETDTIARIGGDEFVLLLRDLSEGNAALSMAERLIRATAQPILIDGLEIRISVSLGLTYFPQSSPVNADQLLRQADHAMYQAKSAGKNRYCVFAQEAILN